MESFEETSNIGRGNRAIIFLSIIMVLVLAALTWFGWYSRYFYLKTNAERERYLKIEALRGTIIYMDEVLTMSALMAAETAGPRWDRRYHAFEPQLIAAIKEATSLAPGAYIGKAAADTDAANRRLVEMEDRSFDLVRQGRLDEARAILYSDEYNKQKGIYSQGMIQFYDGLSDVMKVSLKQEQRSAFLNAGIACLLILLLAVAWIVIFRIVRSLKKESHQQG
jgi:hypothetical protein